jgi:putative nucleotidyltransferase with HDIG domain
MSPRLSGYLIKGWAILVIDIISKIKHNKTTNLLVVDDEPNLVALLQEMLEAEDYNLVSAYSVAEAKCIINRQNIDIVLTDLMLGDGLGIDILQVTKELHPESQVILMTGRPTVQNAVSVLKQGAYEYLVKPFSMETLTMTLRRASEKIRLQRENIQLKSLMSFYQISEAMGSIIELDALLNLILDTTMKEFEADAVSIYLVNEEYHGLELRASLGLLDNDFKQRILEHCLRNSRQTIDQAAPILFNDPETEYLWNEQTIKSSICQPLLAKGKTLGTLIAVRINNNHPYSHGQLTGLTLLASKAAVAIENANLYQDLKKTYIATVEALANAIEARDSYTRGHTERVYLLSRAIAEELSWTEDLLGDLKIGALLHDIGKIGVPDSILNKQGALTSEEAAIMRKHPEIGAKMLESIEFLKGAIPYILYHHERHDGKGYPKGLAGDDIPLPGRLLAVVDTIDAMTSDRPYRKGRPLRVAIDEVAQNSGSQFSPQVADACLSSYSKGKLNFPFLNSAKSA